MICVMFLCMCSYKCVSVYEYVRMFLCVSSVFSMMMKNAKHFFCKIIKIFACQCLCMFLQAFARLILVFYSTATLRVVNYLSSSSYYVFYPMERRSLPNIRKWQACNIIITILCWERRYCWNKTSMINFQYYISKATIN